MNKKDRIAVVLSVLGTPVIFGFLIPFFMGYADVVTQGDKNAVAILGFLILSFYWGYRFIKNDISFLKIKDE